MKEKKSISRKFYHRQDQGGAAEPQRVRKSILEGRIQKKLQFSAHKQLTVLGPNQTVGSESREKLTEAPQHIRWPWGTERGKYRLLGTDGGPGECEKCIQALSAEGEPRVPREEHKSPTVKRAGTGSLEKCTQVSAMQMQRAGSRS